MDQQNSNQHKNTNTVSFLPLGGLENVTRNLYLYEYRDEILIVDCGLGFPDETMIGVDLLLPDISYLLKTQKKIVGMVLTHGHEDHIGAVPFIVPQLMEHGIKPFPIYASPLTAAFTNEKLKEFRVPTQVQTVQFNNPEVKIGSFTATFIRITHSVPDSANIFIKTPAGNFYHGSDFKFDLSPADGRRSDYQRIVKASLEGVTCLMSDCLGSERPGYTPSEEGLAKNFETVLRECKGKFIVTTYSSNIARLNQVIQAAEKVNKKVCFVGRSLVKNKTIGQKLGYLRMKSGTEVEINDLRKHDDNQLVLFVAGSQGQENSAMTRIANGDHNEIALGPQDMVVLSSDPIPGNELSVNALIDSIAKSGAQVLYGSEGSESFHVSGHGSALDLELMISLTKPKYLLPISGKYKHMNAYKGLASKMGYTNKNIFLIENGQEVIFSRDSVRMGKKIEIRNVFVDEVSGEEIENFVLRDREKLAKEGIVVIMIEITADDGQMVDEPDIIARGFSPRDNEVVRDVLLKEIRDVLGKKRGKVTNWVHMRKLIEDVGNKQLFKHLRRRPLILPVIIEV